MDVGRCLRQLEEHQAAIAAIMDRGERLLKDPARDAGALARARWELARAMMAYQGFKHREIFDPVAAREEPARAQVARRLKADCEAMGGDFRAYVTRWSSVGVLDRWDEYQPAALALIRRVREHLARERRATERLLEDVRPALEDPVITRRHPGLDPG